MKTWILRIFHILRFLSSFCNKTPICMQSYQYGERKGDFHIVLWVFISVLCTKTLKRKKNGKLPLLGKKTLTKTSLFSALSYLRTKCKNTCRTPFIEKYNNIIKNKYLEYFWACHIQKDKNTWKIPYIKKRKDVTRNVNYELLRY